MNRINNIDKKKALIGLKNILNYMLCRNITIQISRSEFDLIMKKRKEGQYEQINKNITKIININQFYFIKHYIFYAF